MGFDYRRLRLGEVVAGVCAVLLFIDMFIKWYGVQLPKGASAFLKAAGVSTTADAWRAYSYTVLLLLLLIIVTVAWVVLAATPRPPAMPVAGSVVVTVFAG